jgi:branched-chain amino acid transport system permease protein
VTTPTLDVRRLSKRFGGLVAMQDVDLTVAAGELAVLIGPNGAGKTTVFNCISGVLRPDAGEVVVGDVTMTGRPAHAYAAAGVARTFQHVRSFGGLDVTGNVLIGAHLRLRSGWLTGALRPPRVRDEERRARATAVDLLAELGLDDRRDDRMDDLTLQEERRVEIARCLAAEPTVLLLDEPFAGLGDAEAHGLAQLIQHVRVRHELAVVLIEHHVDLALQLADHVTVLDFGEVIAHGSADTVRRDPRVVEAYIGREAGR